MKKYITTIILLLTIMVSFAQQNFFEQIKKYEGEKFIRYKLSDIDGFGMEQVDTVNIIVIKNKYSRFSGVNIVDKNNKTLMEYVPGDWKLDNPSQPAFMYKVSRGGSVSTVLMFDGILFKGGFSLGFREKFSPDIPEDYLNNYNPSASYVYVPLSLASITKSDKPEKENKKEATKTDAKKGDKMKGFMAKLKSIANLELGSMTTSANLPVVLKKYKSRESINTSIKEYTISMKAIQKSLTEEDRQDYAYVKFQEDSVDAWIKGENDIFWQSEEGQERIKIMNMKKAPTSTFKIVNNTGSTVHLKGSHIVTLNSGDSYEFYCGSSVYYAHRVSTSWKTTSLVTDGKGICGTTINL